MKNIRECYEEYGVYNVTDIINSFKELFDTYFIDVLNEFNLTDKNIISKEKIIDYCIKNFNNLNESKTNKNITEKIINKRIKDYDIIYKKIKTYKNKGIDLLNILIYLQNKRTIEENEKILKELDINHYKNIIVGRDAIRILEAIENIINNYNIYMKAINSYDTYNIQNYDSFYISSRHAYPNESLIDDEEEYDKTSIRRTRKMNQN